MAINDELKKLYKTITDKDAVGMTISEIIAELNENYPEGGGGGSSLPDTTGQSGKFLTNNGTAASWGDVPEVEDYIVEFTLDDSTPVPKHNGDTITIADINDAKEAGKNVKVKYDVAWFEVKVIGESMAAFSASYYNGQTGKTECVTIFGFQDGSSDEWYMSNIGLPNPNPTGDDNGQILGVVGSGYALVSASTLSNAPLYVAISQTGNTLSTDKTAAEITAALDAGKVVVLRYKAVIGAGTPEELTAWSEKTLVGVFHIAATGYELVYVEYDGDTDTWDKFTLAAATGADVFSVTING